MSIMCSCFGKKSYQTFGKAEFVALTINRRRNRRRRATANKTTVKIGRVEPYRCEFCGMYHIGRGET